ncbi:hypothetical protein J3458_022559 [Metarhizium acridum]|uniref:uncharacterized protein n=1 Tax=Metarhizium acridum TaxID=92637 RepID=UPI001C6C11CE|nr:hypothetical protein J3458_022559 [Metarhizium acridum]
MVCLYADYALPCIVNVFLCYSLEASKSAKEICSRVVSSKHANIVQNLQDAAHTPPPPGLGLTFRRDTILNTTFQHSSPQRSWHLGPVREM